jgi:hypothetical protein
MASTKSRNGVGRRWLVRPVTSISREYASLRDEESKADGSSSSHRALKARRRITIEQPIKASWPRKKEAVVSPQLKNEPLVTAASSLNNEELEACKFESGRLKRESLLNWNAVRLSNSEGNGADEDDDEDDANENMLYMADYSGKTSAFSTKKSVDCLDKHSNPKMNLLPPPRRMRIPAHKRRSKRVDIEGQKVELSSSFDTQETQLEEASETSVSTTETDESDVFSLSKPGTRSKAVRWLDQSPVGHALATVHMMEYDVEATCRIVILLLMDHGPQSANNFEFLHCEFHQDDRLRVSDALAQITEIVLGTPDAPKIPPELVHQSKKRQSFRPFTRLCFDGKELVNMFALQDYYLEDGKSILVAIREGSKDRDMLLKQSALLLTDKRLRRGIRKARIAGRSLQTLYGPDGFHELEQRKLEAEKNGKDHFCNNDDDSTCDGTDDGGMDRWSAFDNLSLTSFDDDEFGDASFDTNTSSLSSNWLDDDFFDGKEFFRENGSPKASKNKPQFPVQPFAALNPNGLGWASFEFDPDDDENLFSTIDVSFDVDVGGMVPSGQTPETMTFHGVRSRRVRTTAVNV